MSGKTAWTAAFALFAAAWIFCAPGFAEDEAPRIAKEEVKALMNDPNIALLDARITQDWKKSGQRVAKAVREDPNEIGSWAGKYKKDQLLVFYCD